MHEKHIDQLFILQAKWLQCYTGLMKHENKQHRKAQHDGSLTHSLHHNESQINHYDQTKKSTLG